MNHDELKDALSEYRDGVLPAARRAAVALHLESCAECRAELAFYDRAARALLSPAAAPTSFETEAFVRGVRERLEPSPLLARVFSSPRWALPALAAGFAAAAVAVALPVSRSASGSGDPAEALLIAQDGGASYGWLARGSGGLPPELSRGASRR